jgi:hypothetical protein
MERLTQEDIRGILHNQPQITVHQFLELVKQRTLDRIDAECDREVGLLENELNLLMRSDT